jgi:hypothetical protein
LATAAEGKRQAERDGTDDFAHMILENLKAAGVQQAAKEDRITFTALTGWPGRYICAEGRFMEGEAQRRAGIFIGPEFGTVSAPTSSPPRARRRCRVRHADRLRLQLRRPRPSSTSSAACRC